MNGAESLLRTFVASEVTTCFANPGTSEMHFVAALDRQSEMRCVLGLFEGVVTGAADGYARMTGRPACTLLHLGPGLGNGIANLHNARRARVPVINVVGEHATYHQALDAPLHSDIQGLASAVSGWVHHSQSAQEVAVDAARAVQASLHPPGQVATLVLPADCAWNDSNGPAEPLPREEPPQVEQVRIEEIARLIEGADGKVAFLLSHPATTGISLEILERISLHTGAELLGDTFLTRVERGRNRPSLKRVPYFGEVAMKEFERFQHIVRVGAKEPVSFFAYPERPSRLIPQGTACHLFAEPHQHIEAALASLSERLGVPPQVASVSDKPARLEPPTGDLTFEGVAQSIGATLPEHAIIVNEGATAAASVPWATENAAAHDWLDLMGGAIGQGIPVSTGAAIACPDRRVVSLNGDGSAMYTIQGLWTQAREQLDVTSIIFSNRKYSILQIEFMRTGTLNPGPKAMSMLDLSNPDLDFVTMAKSMGVPGTRVETLEEMNAALERSYSQPGPYLIDVPG